MNFLLVSLLAVGVVSYLPQSALGSSSTGKDTDVEQPRALPLTSAAGSGQAAGAGVDARPNVAGEVWQEDDREVLIRSERGAKNKDGQSSATCRYEKSPWTDCDQSSNMRSRTLTLKKGDEGCVPTRTIQKKCKKACRYEKGEWTKCVNGQITRTDNIKAGCDPTCKQTREVNKNCSKDKKQKKQDKNGRNKSRA